MKLHKIAILTLTMLSVGASSAYAAGTDATVADQATTHKEHKIEKKIHKKIRHKKIEKKAADNAAAAEVK